MDMANLTLKNGRIKPVQRLGYGFALADLLKVIGRDKLEISTDTFKAGATEADRDAAAHGFSQMLPGTNSDVSAHSCGVHFVEVRVDEDFGTVRVKRMVAAFDSGRLYNPKLAESQMPTYLSSLRSTSVYQTCKPVRWEVKQSVSWG